MKATLSLTLLFAGFSLVVLAITGSPLARSLLPLSRAGADPRAAGLAGLGLMATAAGLGGLGRPADRGAPPTPDGTRRRGPRP